MVLPGALAKLAAVGIPGVREVRTLVGMRGMR